MKKIFSFLAAGLLLASCSNDDFSGVKGNEQEVLFSFSLPESMTSRAVAGTASDKGGVSNCEGADVTFTVQVTYGNNIAFSQSQTVKGTEVTFKPTLIVGEKYDVVAYAQMDENGALVENIASNDNPMAATVTELGAINDESQDAYFLSTEMVAEPQMSGVLKRHTGKLRLIAKDINIIEKHLGQKVKSVKIDYKQDRPQEFTIATGTWGEAVAGTGNRALADVAAYSGEGDGSNGRTLFVDYIPAPEGVQELVSFNVVVTFDGGYTFEREIKMHVPIRRNWLTTLTGDFFTSEMDLTLIIDPEFDNTTDYVYDYSALASAFELGGEYTLQNNMVLDKPVVLTEGKELVLNLNGYSISNTADLWNADNKDWSLISVRGGKLTISGDGAVKAKENDCFAVDVQGGEVTINGGSYVGNISAVYVIDGVANINGGEYSIQQLSAQGDERFTLNCEDAAYKAGKAKIVVNGGKFNKFNPGNNAAEGEGTNFLVEGANAAEEGGWFTVGAAPEQPEQPETPAIPEGALGDANLYVNVQSFTLEGTFKSAEQPYIDVVVTGTDLVSAISVNSISSVVKVAKLEGWDDLKGGILRMTLNTEFTLGAGEWSNYVAIQSSADHRIELPFVVTLKPEVVEPEQPETPVEPVVTYDDFSTMSSGSGYTERTSNNGWMASNASLATEPFMVSAAGEAFTGVVLNGKTSAPGSLTSPVIKGGIKTLSFNYGFPFTDDKFTLEINVKKDGVVVKTVTLDEEGVAKLTAYDYSVDLDVDGDVVLEIINKCKSGSSSNKDRLAIWNVKCVGM